MYEKKEIYLKPSTVEQHLPGLEAPSCLRDAEPFVTITLQESWSASIPIAFQHAREVMNEVWLCLLGGSERLSKRAALTVQ